MISDRGLKIHENFGTIWSRVLDFQQFIYVFHLGFFFSELIIEVWMLG